MENIENLTSENIVVIDLDSGTVLGTNLRLTYVSYGSMEEVLSNDHAAIEYARRHGHPLYTDAMEE